MIRRFFLTLVFLCLPYLSYGQEFETAVNNRIYTRPNSDSSFIPPKDDYAVIVVKYVPRGNITNNTRVLSANIVSRVTNSSLEYNLGSLGWYRGINVDGVNGYELCSVIDASTFYTLNPPTSTSLVDVLLPQVQEILVSQNLGTVQQRAAYIASFKLSNVSIIDTSKIVESIVAMLGPWANIGIGIAIALLGIDLGTRKSKKIAGQAAKEARAAERREINKEIRQDPVAAQFRTHLGNLSSVIRDTYGLHGTDSRTRREARALFEQAAKDYAAYKKYRGWIS